MNHLPKHQEGKLFSSRLLLLALLCLAGTACSTTAPTGKILFEDPRGSVSLQTFSKPSIQASHPINLEPALLAQLLTGLEIDDGGVGAHHMKSMQSSVTGTVAISPLFSEDQVQFLAPLLAEGLRRATPNKSIEYRVVTTHEPSNRYQTPITETTTGSLYGHGRQLYVILSQYRYNPMLTNLDKNDVVFRSQERLDYSGLRWRTLRFTPEAAVRADSPNPPTMEKSTDKFVAIDYQLLDRAWRALATKRNAVPHVGGGGEPRAAEAQSRTAEALAREVETLKQELESNQEQLGSQPPDQDSPKKKPAPLLSQ